MTTLQKAFKEKTVNTITLSLTAATILWGCLELQLMGSRADMLAAALIYGLLTAFYLILYARLYFKYKQILDGICTRQNDHLFYRLNEFSLSAATLCFDTENIYLIYNVNFCTVPFSSVIGTRIYDIRERHSSTVSHKGLILKYRLENGRIRKGEVEMAKSTAESPNYALLMKRIKQHRQTKE